MKIELDLTDIEYSEMLAKLANELDIYQEQATDELKTAFAKLAKHRERFSCDGSLLVKKYVEELGLNDDMKHEDLFKVNITPNGDGMNEGVWAEFVTSDDKANYEDETRKGDVFNAILRNRPVLTSDVVYGEIVEVRNMGADRPVLVKKVNQIE